MLTAILTTGQYLFINNNNNSVVIHAQQKKFTTHTHEGEISFKYSNECRGLSDLKISSTILIHRKYEHY